MQTDARHGYQTIFCGERLDRHAALRLFSAILGGEFSDIEIAALLGVLKSREISIEELVGAAEAMRVTCIPVRSHPDSVDTCGTGGNHISTFNVSTTAAIIAAAAGATVAKHGNRTSTRVCGSTEVLVKLGINVEADVPTVERSLAEVRIGYLNARLLHPGMKFVSRVREALPFRTIFNLLGPLANPAGVRRQVLGVPSAGLVKTMAAALVELRAKHAWVVHGADDLCDLTITGPTTIAEVHDGSIRHFKVTPEEVGLPRGDLEALKITSPQESAQAVLDVLNGKAGPRLNHALLNAGAALVVAGVESNLASGVLASKRAVTTGAALDILERWRVIAPLST